MTNTVAARVVALYGTRMQIEESFRDTKSTRYGFALRENTGRNKQPVANLLVPGALGFLATWLMGLHGQLQGLARGLQANTITKRKVLSNFFIGRRLLEKRTRIGPEQFDRAVEHLRRSAVQQAFENTT